MRPRNVIALALASGLVAAVVLSAPPRAELTAVNLPPRAVSMPGFAGGPALGPSEIEDLTEYVLALSQRETDPAAVRRAVPLYEEHCQSCHGVAGTGDAEAGVPDLSDDIWRWGGAREDIREQIWRGDDGRGPRRHAAYGHGRPF